jgi:hypothetical protein
VLLNLVEVHEMTPTGEHGKELDLFGDGLEQQQEE